MFIFKQMKFYEYPSFKVKKLEEINVCDITTTTTTTAAPTSVSTTTIISTTTSSLPISKIKNLAIKVWNAIVSLFKKIF